MRYDALLFDFDGVLIDSEYAGNAQIADFLTAAGYPIRVEDALAHFMGLSGAPFLAAIESWIGGALPDGFHPARAAEDERLLREGVAEVAGAVAFVSALPPGLPRAIVSSSSTHWIRTHLDHLGLRGCFEPMIFSGREDVARGKPAPDIYLHAAAALGVDIARCLVIEDSPVGAEGAVASGAHVVGLCAGRHCASGHDRRLRALGVQNIAYSFDDIARLIA